MAEFLTVDPRTGRKTYNYRVVCDGFCGPGAIAFACGITDPLVVGRLMDWQHHHALGGIREDLQDGPYQHFDAVVRLGKRFRLVTCADILLGRAAPEITLVLLHPNPRAPLLGQHWALFAGLDNAGGVLLHWGNGEIRTYPSPAFEEMYSRGSPSCAYSVGSDGQSRLSWFQRLYVRIMGRFA